MKLQSLDSLCAVLLATGAVRQVPQREYQFHPVRRWRFDLAWPELMLAVEIDGGTWAQGRHTRGGGYAEDCRKLNEAAVLGWTVLRLTTDMVRTGEALDLIERAARAAESLNGWMTEQVAREGDGKRTGGEATSGN